MCHKVCGRWFPPQTLLKHCWSSEINGGPFVGKKYGGLTSRVRNVTGTSSEWPFERKTGQKLVTIRGRFGWWMTAMWCVGYEFIEFNFSFNLLFSNEKVRNFCSEFNYNFEQRNIEQRDEIRHVDPPGTTFRPCSIQPYCDSSSTSNHMSVPIQNYNNVILRNV